MSSPTLPFTGGCACRAVRYQVAAAPLDVYACHCTDCQRITSGAFSIGVVVPDAAFAVVAGSARAAPRHVADSGRVKSRWICADCGTWLYGDPRTGAPAAGPFRIIRGGTLDDASWLRPTAHYWARSKQPWVMLPADATVFDTQPDRG